eukprot:Nk52_evm1s2513 gene=Nk52_evmTU1s2513
MSLFNDQFLPSSAKLDGTMSSQTFQDLITEEVRKMMFTSPLNEHAVRELNPKAVPDSRASGVKVERQRTESTSSKKSVDLGNSDYNADSPNSCTSQLTAESPSNSSETGESKPASKRKRSATEKLCKEERRKRNCAASARFRQKKKQEAAYMEEIATKKTEEAKHLQKQVKTLEKEVAYLKQLLVLCASNGNKLPPMFDGAELASDIYSGALLH